ncbi:endonuclease/Exonuclease/phosphatase [Zalerion maritima]|uniref:CCR4-Not complex 3'-5'-exoribonuclease subunit Ccr4 n=1 Tax=Zalerion maritima TaxID=339359 RepID=A0AAD5RUE8_9PEZI|nr:endonuclease/Exonuclease/phosphatase [Zalerion maritima]
MADGYLYFQQPSVSLLFDNRQTPALTHPPPSLLGPSLSSLTTPSHTPDPDPPPGLNLNTAMFAQNQQGHNARVNGGGPNRGMQQMMYGAYNMPGQGHGQMPQSMQQDPNAHNGNTLGHHSGFSSGVMANASPFTPNSLQNGHGTSAAGTPGTGQIVSEFQTQQMNAQKECEKAHLQMTNPQQQQPHYYARIKANENRGIAMSTNADGNGASETDGEDRRRPWSTSHQVSTQNWNNLDLSGQGLRILTPSLFRYTFLKELYLVSNNLQELPPAIGQLRHLQHLNVSYNQLTEIPPETGMCTYLKQLLAFNNRITHLPSTLGALHNLDMLGLRGNPIDPEVDTMLNERGTKALIEHLKETSPIPMPPDPPTMVVIQEDVSPTLEHVRVLSWNVLCDKFATTNQYGYTPSHALDWVYRRDQILSEIEMREADILTLQEIAMGAFKEFFEPKLKELGYKGMYWPKQRARTMMASEQQAVDGCATFYKFNRFALIDKQLVEFRSLAINRPDMKGQEDIFNRVMPKDNIATICLLESLQTGARMIVVNAHLAWEPHLADVKLIQTAILMEQLGKITEKYATSDEYRSKRAPPPPADEDGADAMPRASGPQEYKYSVDMPLLVCGDFNSTPDSSVVSLLSKGFVPGNHGDFDGRKYGNFTANGIQHPFSLRNTYDCLGKTEHELPFTNYTPGFDGVIDYIWFSTNTMEVVELLGPPDKEYLKRVPGFPHYHFPTDHIQLLADFVIKARKDKKAITKPDFGGSKQ